MEEKKFVQFKKDELGVKEFVKGALGKGRIGNVIIEYTPIGEKIIVFTNKPGFIIGRKGEKINELTDTLRKKFDLENPHIEIQEIIKPEFDAQTVADEIALALERFGSLRFKTIAYKALQKIVQVGALGVEIILGGKLPSERAKSWRFSQGYLKKTGETSKIVDSAKAVAKTNAGVVGVKVNILSPDKKIHDKIEIGQEIKDKIKKTKQINKEEKKEEKGAEKKNEEESTGKEVEKKEKKKN